MRVLLVFALIFIIAFTAAACGTNSTEQSDTVSKESDNSSDSIGRSDETEEITIRMLNWGNTQEEQIAEDAIARFNEKYPNVKVEQTCVPVDSWSDFIQKWVSMCTSGEAPDLINVGLEAMQMAVENDLLISLDNIITEDADIAARLEEIPESLQTGFSIDGSLYGIAKGTQTMVIYYNKNIFDEKSIEYPQEGWTWDDFYETAESLTDGEMYGFGLSSAYFQLSPWWITNSAYPVSDDYSTPTLNSEGMVETVTFLQKLVENKITPDPISSDVYTMFASQQIAMVGAGRWCLGTWQEAGLTADDFDCVQWPENTEAGTVYGGSAWCIGSQTENVDTVVALLKEMLSDETLTASAVGGQDIPPTQALATDSEIMGTVPNNIGGLWEAITRATPVAAPTFFGDLEQALLRGMENIFSGSMTPQDALDQAQSEVEGILGQ